MPKLCDNCSTPLDDAGVCITCGAEAEGVKLLTRSGYASVREMLSLLEGEGLAPEMERVPPSRPEEKLQPLWNLYVPAEEVPRALAFLRKDWAELLDDPDAAAAAARGQEGIDLDAGGDVTCPACGEKFAVDGRAVECPECGLALGVPSNAAPDESKA
jgi:DNA-directed RNA polymerase subunit RPC12/RpoP